MGEDRRPLWQADAPQQRDAAERYDDEGELSGLDAEIEKEQRERDVVRRQPDLAQRSRNPNPSAIRTLSNTHGAAR